MVVEVVEGAVAGVLVAMDVVVELTVPAVMAVVADACAAAGCVVVAG